MLLTAETIAFGEEESGAVVLLDHNTEVKAPAFTKKQATVTSHPFCKRLLL